MQFILSGVPISKYHLYYARLFTMFSMIKTAHEIISASEDITLEHRLSTV